MSDEPEFFIGVPEVARRIKRTRQTVHYRASTGQMRVRAYPLRTGRKITYIFKETEVNTVLEKGIDLWPDLRYREEQ